MEEAATAAPGTAKRLRRTRTPSAKQIVAEAAALQARIERIKELTSKIGTEVPEEEPLDWDISVAFDPALVRHEEKLAEHKKSQWAVARAALKLQCWVRRQRAQKVVEAQYEALMLAEMNRAVTSIQSVYRGKRGRARAMQHLEDRFDNELHSKALACQCLWRMYVAKRRVQRLREAAAARCNQGIELPE